MRFKVDENLPVELADRLTGLGHDAKTVKDELLQGVDDPHLIEAYVREKRILVTLDVDFSDIRTYPPQDNEGIVVLRLSNQSKPHVLEVLDHVLPLFREERIQGRLWVVDENMVRIRGDER